MVVLLTVVSGSIDAVGFLALGGAFSSVMTGNLVLVGVAVATPDRTLLYSAGAAVLCFVLGCALGARLAGTPDAHDGPWPAATTRVLGVELAVLACFSLGWWLTGADPNGDIRLLLLVVNAVALGLQSSAVARFGVPGLSTTYLTGTLTTAVIRLSTGRPLREIGHSVQLLAGLVAGAALGAAITLRAPHLVPAVPLACLGVVVAVGIRCQGARVTGDRR